MTVQRDKDLRFWLKRDERLDDLLDLQLLDQVGGIERQMGPTIKHGDPIQEDKNQDNILFLESGKHGGFTFAKKATIIVGAADAIIDKPVIIKGTASVIFMNCNFVQTKDNAQYFVKVETGGRVQFTGCLFRKTPTNKRFTNTTTQNFYIAMETATTSEDMGSAINCLFIEEGDTGTNRVIGNIGTALGDFFVSYSMNKTGKTLGATSPVGVVT